MRRALVAMALVTAAQVPVGCGDDDGGDSGSAGPRLVVSAASSMTEALTNCAKGYPGATVRLSFAGSDELAAQIRQGVKPDVYAAANTTLPHALADEGLLSKPTEFATNQLVLAVTKGSSIESIQHLTEDGVKIATGSESVPIGSYTRDTLGRLPAAERKAILHNVRSKEPDVKGIVGKLTQGAVDAGFVYVTDVNATDGEVKAIPLPKALEPTVTYAAGVVDGAREPVLGQEFVDGLVDGRCGDTLRHAGFGPAP